jgi:hypothetical protein
MNNSALPVFLEGCVTSNGIKRVPVIEFNKKFPFKGSDE